MSKGSIMFIIQNLLQYFLDFVKKGYHTRFETRYVDLFTVNVTILRLDIAILTIKLEFR